MAFSIQVQAVLFNNNIDALRRSLSSIANAVEVEKKYTSRIDQVTVVYGDASETPLFANDDAAVFSEEFSSLEFEYKFFGENTGYGKGHNLLGLDADVDYLLLINPDLILSPRFFVSHLEPFVRDGEDVGIVEARQTPIEHPKEYDLDTGQTDWASGACMLLKQALFRQLDGFDHETFFMYCEDVDLSWRTRLLGKSILYQPLDPVFHPKHLNNEGHLMPNQGEIRHSAEAHLLLAYKWSNGVRLKQLMSAYKSSSEKLHNEALAAFLLRKQEGRLPKPIEGHHGASTFNKNGEYSEHRFGL